MSDAVREIERNAVKRAPAATADDEEEDRTTALSWTSSSASLTPDHILYMKMEERGPSATDEDTTRKESAAQTHDTCTSFEMNANHDALTSISTLDDPASTIFAYPEDDEGEPVVDESILQILATSSYHDDDNQDDDHPVMLGGEDGSHLAPMDGRDISSAVHPLRDSIPTTSVPASFFPRLTHPDHSMDRPLWNALDTDEGDNETNDCVPLLLHRHGRHPSTIAEEGVFESSLKAPGIQHNILETTTEQYQPLSPPASPLRRRASHADLAPSSPIYTRPLSRAHKPVDPLAFYPMFTATRWVQYVSMRVLPHQHVPYAGAATWMGFWALLFVTCANYVLTPMRDAMALQVGVQHIPQLTLASTVLAVVSSVPMGWLFEAPDPSRRRLWKRMGLTRGETQGTSLALFYRIFAWIVIAYAVGFTGLEWFRSASRVASQNHRSSEETADYLVLGIVNVTKIWSSLGPTMFIAFFLIVHLMKLHCLSLVWGVATEAMEYEDVARQQHQKTSGHTTDVPQMESQKMRLKRLSLIGFGGTLGGIMGSFLASAMAQILQVPGLLLLAAVLLEISAELSIEMGRIMKKHWEEQQQLFQSTNDLASLDPSMHRSTSLGSMKRISSGNSLSRVKSTSDLDGSNLAKRVSSGNLSSMSTIAADTEKLNADSFSQRMMRGITTILRSRLLMAIFTYNALYASTTVLLSFQRAALIAGRKQSILTTTVQADTAFLAKINMASSAAIFALQASGVGASVAHQCGSRGTLALMPMIRLLGVVALAWWHRISGGQAPNLLVFLVADECCKIMNLAVAKPVRESLWRGLSNEARYEAKPIVDTLANRWGGGSAAFLVSFVDKTLDLFSGPALDANVVRTVFGFPPVLFLCVVISAWWAAVSADLGHIRMKIDLELKKRQ